MSARFDRGTKRGRRKGMRQLSAELGRQLTELREREREADALMEQLTQARAEAHDGQNGGWRDAGSLASHGSRLWCGLCLGPCTADLCRPNHTAPAGR